MSKFKIPNLKEAPDLSEPIGTLKDWLTPGDTIRCMNSEDAAEVAEALGEAGYEWDFVYELNGKKGIWIEILGRSESK